jgi:hypothetical protein
VLDRALGVCVLAVSFAWLVFPAPVLAETASASILTPVDGATSADFTVPIRWSAVPGAEAYYLYVGSTAGAKDLLDSGQVQQTSVGANRLPLQQRLYARLWTKLNGVWTYRDSTFTGTIGSAMLTYPANASTTADLTLPLTWSGVTTAQAYYLYVGTAPGLKDLIDSGEIRTTSYAATKIPENQTVHARVWTKLADGWRYTDSSFRGERLVARITAPGNGTAFADWWSPIQWTSVLRAQAYYLYMGSTPGANDLANSGETQQTSYRALTLPIDRVVHARLWTKVDGVWRFTDSSFSGALLTSEITYPVNGSTAADLARDIQWTTVSNAEAYYLYIGTTPAGKDHVDSGELLGTSYTARNLPADVTLHARLWTRAGGVWRFSDTAFKGAPVTSALVYPPNGSTTADAARPFEWTSVPGADAYYLYVGTSPGARDLVDSGERQQTSYAPRAPLPSGRTLHARIWARTSGIWRFTDSTFSLLPAASILVYPPAGAGRIDKSRPATWTSVAGAEAYYLFMGTEPGGADLVNTGETLVTSRPIDALPVGPTLYATLWTKVAGVWRYTQSHFSAGPLAPEFTYPQNGATSVDISQPFQWLPPSNAEQHWLYVGTGPGANDLLDSGALDATTFTPSDLPDRRTLYARVWSRVDGRWTRYTDIAFSPRAPTRGTFMIAPRSGETFDGAQPFRWLQTRLAQGYRLTIGLTEGAADLHDSGEIQVTRRFVPGLPAGATLFGRLYTKIDGTWWSSDFTFTMGSGSPTNEERIASALWATDFVRGMADAQNRPYAWSALISGVAPRYNALCSDYAEMLVRILSEVNIGLPARRVDVSFNGTNLDAHSLVEMLNPDTDRWMLLDPTFNLAAKRDDGSWAGPDDVSQATRASNWTAISYVFLGQALDALARDYYLDYPLLFVNVYHPGDEYRPGVGGTIVPFLVPVAGDYSGERRGLAVRCQGSTTAEAIVDGRLTEVACNAADGFSSVFYASTVTAPGQTEKPFAVYLVPRFVF